MERDDLPEQPLLASFRSLIERYTEEKATPEEWLEIKLPEPDSKKHVIDSIGGLSGDIEEKEGRFKLSEGLINNITNLVAEEIPTEEIKKNIDLKSIILGDFFLSSLGNTINYPYLTMYDIRMVYLHIFMNSNLSREIVTRFEEWIAHQDDNNKFLAYDDTIRKVFEDKNKQKVSNDLWNNISECNAFSSMEWFGIDVDKLQELQATDPLYLRALANPNVLRAAKALNIKDIKLLAELNKDNWLIRIEPNFNNFINRFGKNIAEELLSKEYNLLEICTRPRVLTMIKWFNIHNMDSLKENQNLMPIFDNDNFYLLMKQFNIKDISIIRQIQQDESLEGLLGYFEYPYVVLFAEQFNIQNINLIAELYRGGLLQICTRPRVLRMIEWFNIPNVDSLRENKDLMPIFDNDNFYLLMKQFNIKDISIIRQIQQDESLEGLLGYFEYPLVALAEQFNIQNINLIAGLYQDELLEGLLQAAESPEFTKLIELFRISDIDYLIQLQIQNNLLQYLLDLDSLEGFVRQFNIRDINEIIQLDQDGLLKNLFDSFGSPEVVNFVKLLDIWSVRIFIKAYNSGLLEDGDILRRLTEVNLIKWFDCDIHDLMQLHKEGLLQNLLFCFENPEVVKFLEQFGIRDIHFFTKLYQDGLLEDLLNSQVVKLLERFGINNIDDLIELENNRLLKDLLEALKNPQIVKFLEQFGIPDIDQLILFKERKLLQHTLDSLAYPEVVELLERFDIKKINDLAELGKNYLLKDLLESFKNPQAVKFLEQFGINSFGRIMELNKNHLFRDLLDVFTKPQFVKFLEQFGIRGDIDGLIELEKKGLLIFLLRSFENPEFSELLERPIIKNNIDDFLEVYKTYLLNKHGNFKELTIGVRRTIGKITAEDITALYKEFEKEKNKFDPKKRKTDISCPVDYNKETTSIKPINPILKISESPPVGKMPKSEKCELYPRGSKLNNPHLMPIEQMSNDLRDNEKDSCK